MANLLYLVHRLPYPPNKGDKVRSYHLLKHLAKKHRVYLGSFIDDPDDERYLAELPQYCVDMHIARLKPIVAKISSIRGLLSNQPLTLPYYKNQELQNWVNHIVENEKIETAIIFSSAMAAYIQNMPKLRALIDYVDVDSAKWTQYADKHHWPLSWLYRREGSKLLDFERKMALHSEKSFFVTDNEVDLFRRLAPECTGKISAMSNGVDADFFSPDHDLVSPYGRDEIPIVFTGAMDYWPNVDAVTWFDSEMLPKLMTKWPKIRFYIVGRNPSAAVQALAKTDRTVVTGTVPDVRPYLRHAKVVVAPLRLARGIQNKILEAMAIGRPVVASQECATAVDAIADRDFLVASTAEEYIDSVDKLLCSPDYAVEVGRAARRQVVAKYSWDAHLSNIDTYLEYCA
ncbi:MAG: TIGR03087 family PEP-CTERM/XrtA system glycosyltransferase [Candidatus Accumulibacter sp.]|nr:TIGR03087 family PEP-CTERM/XrtA system glycosyltransferase [Accumulibacter sp.]